jgi:hypothetical protein
MQSPVAWSVSIVAEPAAVLAADWYEQQTICGDFLRQIRHLQMNPDEPLGLESLLPEHPTSAALAAAADVSDRAVRERVLRETAMLGIDLLSPE